MSNLLYSDVHGQGLHKVIGDALIQVFGKTYLCQGSECATHPSTQNLVVVEIFWSLGIELAWHTCNKLPNTTINLGQQDQDLQFTSTYPRTAAHTRRG